MMVYGKQAISKILFVVHHGHTRHCLNIDGSDILAAGKCFISHIFSSNGSSVLMRLKGKSLVLYFVLECCNGCIKCGSFTAL